LGVDFFAAGVAFLAAGFAATGFAAALAGAFFAGGLAVAAGVAFFVSGCSLVPPLSRLVTARRREPDAGLTGTSASQIGRRAQQ
jgi:hypothetical protein